MPTSTKNIKYSLPVNFLNLRIALGLAFGMIIFGTLGFRLIEGYNWGEAFYMTIITISTVGFTEVQPLTETGRLFASIFILLNVGVFAYTLSVFSYYVVQGEIFKTIHMLMINKEISQLEEHVILCGFGKYGREIAQHFHEHNIPFVIIEYSKERIEEIRSNDDKILYIEGDATDEDTLDQAGIRRAKALIVALPTDSDNVFTVLTARQMNAEMNIISRVIDSRSVSKLRIAGANHLITPEQIGGFYMAMLVSKPGAIEFFSFLTNKYEGDIGFEEINFEAIPERMRDKSIRELQLRSETGTNIIGFRSKSGRYTVNPTPETKLTDGCCMIVIGNRTQLERLHEFLEIK